MAEKKKGILSGIFGGKQKGCCCNMQIVVETDDQEQKPKAQDDGSCEQAKEEE